MPDFIELANQYKKRHLALKLKPYKKEDDTIIILDKIMGQYKQGRYVGRIKRLMKIPFHDFDMIEMMSWSRTELRSGPLK